MNESMVSIKGLVKRYGSFTAVNGIDIEVGRGEVFGLLGPNGAGKTTTLECLEGMRKSDGGRLRVAGCDPQTDERKLRRKLGVQLQSSALPDCIRVGEALSLISSWHGLPEQSDLIEKFEINALMKKQYRELSTGQKRRLHLVLALVNKPEVIILDEPTAGLDVQTRAQLHEEIRSIKTQGITVLLATHDMAEAEVLCDRIAIMIHGKLAVCGTPEQVTAAGSKETRIRLRTSNGSLLPGADIGGAAFISVKDGYLEWNCRDIAPSVAEILNRIQAAEDTIEDLRVERPSLEERFLELVEGAQ
jgi:ABC-2 type transport system ATP-binding protein